MVAQVGAVDELRLAGQVDVVGAGGRAGRDQRVAVLEVGTNGSDHHAAPLGQRAQRRFVVAVDDDQLEVRGSRLDHGQPVAQCGQLLLAAAGETPAEVGRGGAGQVLGGERAGEAGRAHHHDVEVSGHGQSLRRTA